LCSPFRFAVTFSLPYLLNAPYANLGSKVGFIFGSISVLSLVFAYFCVPNVAGSTLEEVDQLFASDLPLRKFKRSRLPATVPDNTKVDDFKSLEAGQHVEKSTTAVTNSVSV
jgi:MFS transporter, SP family, sugar:H+ symporter